MEIVLFWCSSDELWLYLYSISFLLLTDTHGYQLFVFLHFHVHAKHLAHPTWEYNIYQT